ncbi:hypothetical protein ILUMI_05444 [Ignelater luminosus]|uniref:Uncharacterized protein n=1 Tax=Ignelater luminosus TaxID=2038154 RepID=A0A8K0DCY5_IGNLU|nr:hypothetical protein ILUMI_05444 [Ignelater luminosus]
MIDSYKRDALWKTQLGNKIRLLMKICNTRWWSKAKALQTIFGSINYHENELYSILLVVLYTIPVSDDFDGRTSSDARSLLDTWTSYETLVLAFTFMAVFQHFTPVSNYLQTQGLDISQAFNIIRNAKKKVEQLYDSFAGIVSKVNKIIHTINGKDVLEETDIYIETEFPPTRQRKVKKMPGEECIDKSSTISQQGPSKKIEIDTYKMIINQITQSLNYRYTDYENTYRSFYYFDLHNFTELRNAENINSESFPTIQS